ncbi:prephenate dehydrogenase/arogenate dehydrogenase family protein [Bacillus cereus]|uniref:Prephenate dehydrogenase/arogenate dehydrogenase family protein n=1 Tax=Bacillus cereus TaxID=1396 RepID=A0A9W7Q318_BACCE|nr:prephenate dehydrogenase/arogenate dehydrogenase family protein [Bacillus cereus]KAA6459467.1 prephenate dehydrogenase/arogenate dehydrogenase family protein [Bacillus cereus]KAB2502437.1 prephenate dehydrogenase/arogenate dehydrogenase family protein [Bacillus cereus]
MIPKISNCVIIGGSGGIGGMFSSLLADSGIHIHIIDINNPREKFKYEKCDVTNPTTEAINAIKIADMVLLALPENIALQAVEIIASEMKEGSLLAHTLSVQSHINKKIKSLNLPLDIVGLNPMFSPNLSIVNRPIAVVIQKEGPKVNYLLDLIVQWGAHLVHVDSKEHDELCAILQALTHASILAFGLALSNLNVDIKKLSSLAPPPHANMLALLARISGGVPEVYWDIQSANMEAPLAREALMKAVEQLNAAAKDETQFANILTTTQKVFGDQVTSYKDLCTRIFNGPLSPLIKN